uniref:Major facilitator superfamily domain-containing protein 12 n=1 Tax=Panagrolaimus sp. ES5 TaxID=591445 RepID=A0AC34FCI7_9BILA
MDDAFSEAPLLVIAENEEEVPEVLRTYNPQSDNDGEISKKAIFGYSLGHIFNDMCSSMWFTYLMIYLEKVIKMRSWRAGLLMLIGQVTDGIATPVIGLISDSSILPQSIVKFGQRIPWHFVGFIMVTFSFPFVFNGCLLCKPDTSENWSLAYYIPLVMAFQIGWAGMQVNHLALIPTIAEQESCQRTLSTSRLAASVLANLTVFIILFIRFTLDSEDTIGPSDLTHFRSLALIVVGAAYYIPLVMAFQIGWAGMQVNHLALIPTIAEQESCQRTLSTSRLAASVLANLTVFIILFIRFTLDSEDTIGPSDLTHFRSLALIVVGAGVVVTLLFYILCREPPPQHYGEHLTVYQARLNPKEYLKMPRFYTVAIIYMLSRLYAAGLLYFKLPHWIIYITAATMGIAQSLLLTAAFAFCNFLIGADKSSSAFIYGSMSFADKLVNGIVYQIIELINPSCNPHVEHEECAIFYRNIMVFIPGTCALFLAFFGILFVASRIRIQISVAPFNENNQNILLNGQRNNS